MENITVNKYYFQGMRWVPGYNDVDWDDCEVEAIDEKEAWEKLYKLTKKWTWRNVGLTYVNGVKIV